ncbi:hypothetical protein [Rossellomorea marisflavi]|uniref:hypothetical protein n=1 Tax=Rossellomorea marisflavi TaxID=189381 RepID=UPI003FA12825
MSVRPTLLNIIGAEVTKEDMQRFKEFGMEQGEELVADLLKDSSLLSPSRDFPVLPSCLQMEWEDIAIHQERAGIIGFKPAYHLDEASLHDHQLIWSLIEAGILSGEGFHQKIPYEDYSGFIGAPKEELMNLPLSARMQMRNYEGEWGRRYKHSPINYFDEEMDIALELFKRIGIELNRSHIQRYVVLEWD